MSKIRKVYLICYDDHRGFTEDVRKKFDDQARYVVISFQTRKEFIDYIFEKKDPKFCKVAILGVHEYKEQIEMISKFTMEIKSIDAGVGLILLVVSEMLEEVKKSVKFNIDAFIPKNANAIPRIHNVVKKLSSEHTIGIFRRKMNFSVCFLFAFLLLSVLIIIISFFFLPEYF